MSRAQTPAEFLRSYNTKGDSPSRRLANLLHDGARACPGLFFPKPQVARHVLKLGRTPSEDSDDVKKRLASARSGANGYLARVYKREIVTDRLEGIRATVDDEDLLKNRHRPKRRRVQSAITSLKETDGLIDPKNLSPSARAEFQSATATIRRLQQTALQLPQLLNGTGKAKEKEPQAAE